MSSRDAYVEKMKARIDEWNADMAQLEAKARGAQADARLKYDEQIQALKKHRQEAQERLREVQSASEESWERLREGMEAAWNDMSKAFRDAADRFR
jgi:chromosome segregation ATPase